jgi:hypothetical protein
MVHMPSRSGPPFHRYVALGDSFTEGVGDHDPLRPNGVRGWADRVAEVLASHTDDLGYANLAIRGRKMATILAEQQLRDTGAHVVLFTAFDLGFAPVFRHLRGRVATYNQLVREIADVRGATVVDFWRFRQYRDERLWDVDRLHMSSAGHQRMAIEVLDTLRVEHDLVPFELAPLPEMDRRQRRNAHLAWARAHAGPWVRRRLRETSSGDGLPVRRPTLDPVHRGG